MATPNTPDNILVVEQVASTPEASSKSTILTHTKAGLAMVVLAMGINGNAVAQDKVNASTAPTVATVSAEGLVVETSYGALSFADIQKHPKKEEILAVLKPSKQAKFLEWEQQVAVNGLKQAKAEGEIISQRASAEIERFAENVKILLAAKKKLDNDVKQGIRKAIAYGKPPETIKFLQTVLNNQDNFV